MAKVLYLHGLSSGPHARKAGALRDAGHEVLAPELDYGGPSFLRARGVAQAALDRFRPDALVGSSLGAATAMSLASGATPMVLVAPAWDLSRVSPRRGGTPRRGDAWRVVTSAATATLWSPAVAGFIAELWDFDVPTRVKPETLVLHAADDEMVDVRHSRALLDGSGPAQPDSPVHAALRRLSDEGYTLGDAAGRGDPRLVVIGRGHACNDPSLACPRNPGRRPLQGLCDAVGALLSAAVPMRGLAV